MADILPTECSYAWGSNIKTLPKNIRLGCKMFAKAEHSTLISRRVCDEGEKVS